MYDNLIAELKTKEEKRKKVENEVSSKKCISVAEWIKNPDNFNKEYFFKEISSYLYTTYNNCTDIDRHLIAMLADTIETYIQCRKILNVEGYVIDFNDGKTSGTNPIYKTMDNALSNYLLILNELQITPKARIKNGIKEPTEMDLNIARLMRGPEVYK